MLEWVQEYIADYGGDKTNVTLWGEISGATSALLHALMADAKFNRLILQVGPVKVQFVVLTKMKLLYILRICCSKMPSFCILCRLQLLFVVSVAEPFGPGARNSQDSCVSGVCLLHGASG